MTIDHDDHELEDHDRGLAFDMSTLLHRRRVLQLIGGAGLLALVGCGSDATSSTGTSATTSAAGSRDDSGHDSDDGDRRLDLRHQPGNRVWIRRGDPRGDRRAVSRVTAPTA